MLWSLLLLAGATGTVPGLKVQVESDHPPYWAGESFTVYEYKDEKSCDLGNRNSEDEYLTVTYNALEKSAHMMVTNKNATSLKNNQKVMLQIFFSSDGQPSLWRSGVIFTAVTMPDGTRALVSDELGTTFLQAISSNEKIGVFTSNTALVARFDLAGSQEAIAQLVACAKDAANINPLDPFQQ